MIQIEQKKLVIVSSRLDFVLMFSFRSYKRLKTTKHAGGLGPRNVYILLFKRLHWEFGERGKGKIIAIRENLNV